MKKHRVIVSLIIMFIVGFLLSNLPKQIFCKVIVGKWDYQNKKCIL
jgi:hypothetical protein